MSPPQERPAINFHFVTGNPQSELEKRSVRTIVRSNASNRRWRLVRETAAKSKGRDGVEAAFLTKETDQDDELQSDERPPRSRKVDLKQRSHRQIIQHQRRQQRTGPKPTVLPTQGPVQVVNLAQYPFGALPVTEISQQSVLRMLQGTAISYASLFPSGQGQLPSKLARDWFQQCLSTSGILHTALFCQAMRVQASRPELPAIPSTELVLCQTEAVRTIKQKLTQVRTACDDESIRICFSLTWHGPIKQDASNLTPRQSPLSHIQSLKLFMGTIARDPLHAAGLANMLRLRGGLDKVDMPGLAFLVSLGDILQACSELTRPAYPYPSYTEHNPDAMPGQEWPRLVRQPCDPLDRLGLGFPVLHYLLPSEWACRLCDVFSRFADFTRATEAFVKTDPKSRNTALMADQRNSIQHQMMSLRLGTNDDFIAKDVFELVWLSGLVYSFIVVFPLAPRAARFDRLAEMIKDLISRLFAPGISANIAELRLWVLFMGGICSLGTAHRCWYVHALRKEKDELGILTWQDLKGLVMQFLWSPLTSDGDGQTLWDEMTDTRSPPLLTAPG